MDELTYFLPLDASVQTQGLNFLVTLILVLLSWDFRSFWCIDYFTQYVSQCLVRLDIEVCTNLVSGEQPTLGNGLVQNCIGRQSCAIRLNIRYLAAFLIFLDHLCVCSYDK